MSSQAVNSPQFKSDAEALAYYRAENERLKAAKVQAITVKTSPSGVVSVYGLGRFPTSLYPGQWEQLSMAMPKVLEHIRVNAVELAKLGEASKAAKVAAKAAGQVSTTPKAF